MRLCSLLIVVLALLRFSASDGVSGWQEVDFEDWLISTRRWFHQHPELGFEEWKTSEYIREVLKEMGIRHRHGVAGTGVVAEIGHGLPAVALRTDMDALPVQEAAPDAVGFRSQHDGRMHACGHDAHMAMLLGAARLLQSQPLPHAGCVRLLFQPAEEGLGGARAMASEGVLDNVTSVFGIHVWPDAPSGTVTTRYGTIMAASDRFEAVVVGRGGHAAMPHLTADPVVAASAAVMALQSIISREISPLDGGVVSVARFNTGSGAPNVIPSSAELAGTIRSLTFDGQDRLRKRVEDSLRSTAAAHRCNLTITWKAQPTDPTVNAPAIADLVAEAAQHLQLASPDRVKFEWLKEPTMAAEDFGFFAKQVPSAFAFLGIGDPSLRTTTALHNPAFQMDERQLALGAKLHVQMAYRMLEAAAAQSSSTDAGAERTEL